MPRKKTPITEDFLDLQSRLAAWRSRHPPRSPLPEEFWTAAVELARKHGLYRTARALPVDYANLRKRLNGVARPEAVVRPEFMELFTAPAPASCCVEVLRVQLSGSVDWSQLLRAWRQTER
jgi:hypothetical protein